MEEKTVANTSAENDAPASDYLYLRSVNIKEYRTIKDCSVDFQPGLNIIIGKNGVGKTNFMNALNQAINFGSGEFSFGEARLKLFKNGETDIHIPTVDSLSENYTGKNAIYVSSLRKITLNGQEVNKYHDLIGMSLFSSSIIRHGLPIKQLFFIQEPVTLELTGYGKVSSPDISKMVFSNKDYSPYFEKLIFYKILNASQDIHNTLSSVNADNFEEYIDKITSNVFDSITELNAILKKYSPIQQVYANRNVSKYFDKEYEKAIAKNLMIEFDIKGSVLPFESLSDGTKRMFYIICEVAIEGDFYFGEGFVTSAVESSRVLLIEEPELGIHPHQLQLLMDFLKEQSQYKQIIITTHSPQVLDILKAEELNRVIIASHTPEKGTQLRHLTEKEEAKAKNYMHETGFLSDYWKYSDLESN